MIRNEITSACKEEIRRAYRILGADRGIQQNALDIQGWRNCGFINNEEYHELRKYSRDLYATMD